VAHRLQFAGNHVCWSDSTYMEDIRFHIAAGTEAWSPTLGVGCGLQCGLTVHPDR